MKTSVRNSVRSSITIASGDDADVVAPRGDRRSPPPCRASRARAAARACGARTGRAAARPSARGRRRRRARRAARWRASRSPGRSPFTAWPPSCATAPAAPTTCSTAASECSQRLLRVERRTRRSRARAGRARARRAGRCRTTRLRAARRLCIARMNARSMYTEAIATPVEAMSANTSLALNTPSRIRNSPAKFAEPGHRERRERDDQEQRREHRRAERDAAHLADVLGAGALVQQQR